MLSEASISEGALLKVNSIRLGRSMGGVREEEERVFGQGLARWKTGASTKQMSTID